MDFSYLIFVCGLFFLVKGSDSFVERASSIAKRLGISDFIIGITIVAIGTSIPELVSSIFGVLDGATEFPIGNAVGSNIANIGLILGLSAMFMPLVANKEMFFREGLLMLIVTGVFFGLQKT